MKLLVSGAQKIIYPYLIWCERVLILSPCWTMKDKVVLIPQQIHNGDHSIRGFSCKKFDWIWRKKNLIDISHGKQNCSHSMIKWDKNSVHLLTTYFVLDQYVCDALFDVLTVLYIFLQSFLATIAEKFSWIISMSMYVTPPSSLGLGLLTNALEA